MAGPVGETKSVARLRQVEVKRKTLERYRDVVGDEAVEEVRDLGRLLRGLRVLEISATATGGGVAELLSSTVPLLRDIGLDVEWRIIAGEPAFFEVTKKLHNGLQGMEVDLTPADEAAWLGHNEAHADLVGGDWDFVVVHDPQPAAMRSFLGDQRGRWLWRCHVDSSSPDPAVAAFLRPYIERHDHAVFTLAEFVPPGLNVAISLQLPAIDPLTSKNRDLPAYLARETVAELGIDLARPLLLQVSRFDPWKDPLGVVEVWRRARERFPALQLALVGSMAADDPEGWRVYEQIEEVVHDEPTCFLFTDQMGVASHEVNAFQRVADVAVQKSIREGFGLVVAETLWKGTPMVAGDAGGIPVQLEHAVSGFLAESVDDFAARVQQLLEDPVQGRELGAAGAARVRDSFLTPRLLCDQLRLLHALAT